MSKKLPKKLEEALKKTIDPETGINLYDMGMIKDVKVEGKKVSLKLAIPFGCAGCGIIAMMIEDLRKNIKNAGYEPKIEIG